MEEILCNHDNYGGLYLDMTFNEKKLGYWEWEMEIIYTFFGFIPYSKNKEPPE